MVLPGEPATWRREGAGRYIAFPGVATLPGCPVDFLFYSGGGGVQLVFAGVYGY